MDFDRLTTRDVPIVPERAALLVVDVQNFSARRDAAEEPAVAGLHLCLGQGTELTAVAAGAEVLHVDD